jgi:aubergine-like protein
MIAQLFNSEKCKQWGITFDNDPIELKSRKLAAPALLGPNGSTNGVMASDQSLKREPVFNSKPLSRVKILLVHESYTAREAQNVADNLMKCQGNLRVKTDNIRTLCFERAKVDKFKAYQQQLADYMQRQGLKDNGSLFVVYILDFPSDYPKVKRVLTELNLLSQIITKSTAKRFNLSVASNVIKQINSKLGGESIRLEMPSLVSKELIMVIGIDVCHSGPNSIVGFCATLDNTFNRYYNDFIIQPKFQELVENKLDKCLRNALEEFKTYNKGQMPRKIIVYRDGVGEQMRDQIIQKEISQFKATVNTLYNKMAPPQMSLVVVNKRINQRFFVDQGNQYANPPPGSIIDAGLVENNDQNKCFDFFLVPQQTTQGCATPTHFYVCYNESTDLSKEDFETMTFNLCFMYSNWSGSIKVPAPCQNAHKLAEYHNLFDQNGRLKRSSKIEQK